MDGVSLNTLLFAGKWAFIGLVYLILILVVIAVRREMIHRTAAVRPSQPLAPGSLRVLQAGGDRQALPGSALPLRPLTRLGAAPENDIVLTDPYVSAQHALLTWDGSTWWLEDLDSTNGSRLNGVPCPPHVPCQLAPGSRLAVGDMLFELVL